MGRWYERRKRGAGGEMRTLTRFKKIFETCHRGSPLPARRMVAAAVLSLTLPLACLLGQAQTTTWLTNGTAYIGPTDLPQSLAPSLQVMGSRMTGATTALMSLTGSITDSNGTRAAAIVIQAPGYLAYREGSTRAITYNGSQFSTLSGSLSTSDEQVAESFLAHFPDTVFLQFAAGGGWRRIGNRFRNVAGNSPTYTGPYWTLWAFSPKNRAGLTRGQALQQEIFVAVNEQTGLIDEVRVVTNTAPKVQNVIETQFNKWAQSGGQWFPGQIVRLENGKQVLSFQTQTGAVGSATALSSFQP